MGWPGYFISLEGLDGAGKSTQVASLAGALRAETDDVVVVRPADTGVGGTVRGFLLQHQVDVPVDPWAEALLFVAGRVQLLREVVMPALQRGAIVLADRYADSTLAYQGGGRGLDTDVLRTLHRVACGDVWPDMTLLLDLPLDVGVRRQREQELPIDRIEMAPEEFHRRVRDTFEQLAAAEPDRIVRIDATQPPTMVSRQINDVVQPRLAAWRERRPSAVPSPA